MAAWRGVGDTVALVPTMGALHAGHLAIVAQARAAATRAVVSIFVNPTQFAPGEDFDRYPRDLAGDAAKLAGTGVDLLYAPTPGEIYPDGFTTTVTVAGLSDQLDGAHRPGHFTGVATVVAKLLGQVRPDIAIFGEKDWQQLLVLKRMVADLDLGIAVHAAPIVRDADGLAMSSRNAYLTADERGRALALPRALAGAERAIAAGAPVAAALAAAQAALDAAGFDPVDYVALVGPDLMPVDRPVAGGRLLAAARIGRTRLIDNLPVG